jgi:hypothetical protein
MATLPFDAITALVTFAGPGIRTLCQFRNVSHTGRPGRSFQLLDDWVSLGANERVSAGIWGHLSGLARLRVTAKFTRLSSEW